MPYVQAALQCSARWHVMWALQLMKFSNGAFRAYELWRSNVLHNALLSSTPFNKLDKDTYIHAMHFWLLRPRNSLLHLSTGFFKTLQRHWRHWKVLKQACKVPSQSHF